MELITRVLAGVIAAWIPIEATSKRAISGQELERRLTSGPSTFSVVRSSAPSSDGQNVTPRHTFIPMHWFQYAYN
jgi:hypothetical protein